MGHEPPLRKAPTWFVEIYIETLVSLSPWCLFLLLKQPFPTWLSRPPGALVTPDGLDRGVALARDWKEMCQEKLRGCRESLCAQTSFCLVPGPDTRLLFPLSDCLTNSKLLLWLDLSETMHPFPPSLTSTDIALDLLALWVHAAEGTIPTIFIVSFQTGLSFSLFHLPAVPYGVRKCPTLWRLKKKVGSERVVFSRSPAVGSVVSSGIQSLKAEGVFSPRGS